MEESRPRLHRHGVSQPPQDQTTSRGREGVAAENQEEAWTMIQRRRRRDTPPQERRLVDPLQECRCFHCLALDHFAHACREPIRCRLCRRKGQDRLPVCFHRKRNQLRIDIAQQSQGYIPGGGGAGGGAPTRKQIKSGL